MGVCHFDRKSSTQKSGNLPKIETQKSGSLPKIETQKSGNPKRQAFRLHEKTCHPDQKVFDLNSMFQFHLFYQKILQFNFWFMMICAGSFKFSSSTISLSCDICSVSKINIILPLWVTFIMLGSSQMNNVS